MKHIHGQFTATGKIDWQTGDTDSYEGEGLVLGFMVYSCRRKREALTRLSDFLLQTGIKWLRPIREVMGEWLLDVEELRAEFDLLEELDWLTGKVAVTPECEVAQHGGFEILRAGFAPEPDASIQFVVTQDEMRSVMPTADLSALTPFLKCFQVDHPEPSKCAFIMIKYEDTPQHQAIVKAVREACAAHGFTALRADDKPYSDDLLYNIRTYMHSCGFGIAVFERLTADDFNPNVSLEVGYMMALGKPLCLLKDSTLSSLQTDLVGRLYESFDTHNPVETIPPVLEKWLRDKSLI